LTGAPALPGFGEALKTWAFIGCVNFGGPAGQIALMHRILVEEKKWISEARFFHALNYCMLLPGPEAQQLATYVGWLMHGVRGGLAAGLLFILPGALVMLGLSLLYVTHADRPEVAAVFWGIKAAVLAIVIDAILRIARRAFTNRLSLVIAVAAFAALFLFNVAFPLVILAAGLAGFAGAALQAEEHDAADRQTGHRMTHAVDAALAQGLLVHTRTTTRQTFTTVALWLAIWLMPVGLLLAAVGQEHVLARLAVFFSTMSVVTFGGAYAVLAYVAQEAVATHQWLNAAEMMDGLALAETTPGPLILVLQHVGFLAASRHAGLDPLLAGLAGAAVTLWVTFAPSFLWIFAGAPYAERLRGNRALSGALAAITAAVVGVIANLAVWFGLHVLFAKVDRVVAGPFVLQVPDMSTLDPMALVLAFAATVALTRARMPIPALLFVSAGAGLLLGLVRAAS
jgi:chromate transporter